MEVALVIVAVIAYLGFREWLRHQRRALIHKERLAAVEKGVELPPLEHEVHRRALNVQRILLLAGLIWIASFAGVYALARLHLERYSGRGPDRCRGEKIGLRGAETSESRSPSSGPLADAMF